MQGWSPSTFTVADHAKTGFPLVFPHANVNVRLPYCRQARRPLQNQVRALRRLPRGRTSGTVCRRALGQPLRAVPQRRNLQSLRATRWPNIRSPTSRLPADIWRWPATNATSRSRYESNAVSLQLNLVARPAMRTFIRVSSRPRMAARDKSGKAIGCVACHSTKEWKDLSKFDHSQTSFPLVGTHRAVACADCHKPPNMELNMMHVQFASAPKTCAECHENPHSTQFGERANDCASCHNSNKWRPSLFDHDKTRFPLKGGHEDVACSACHSLKKDSQRSSGALLQTHANCMRRLPRSERSQSSHAQDTGSCMNKTSFVRA